MEARMRVSVELLVSMMQLPEGTRILDASMDNEIPGMLSFIIDHEEILTDYVNPTYTRMGIDEDSNQTSIKFASW